MRLSHDEYYLQMLQLVAARSTCVRRAVGAILVDQQHQILSTGYNGVPQRFPHCTESPCIGAQDPRNDLRRCLAVHAEANTIIQCKRLDLARTLYTSCTPCFDCAKLICNTPIEKVVALELYPGEGLAILGKRGIKVLVAKS